MNLSAVDLNLLVVFRALMDERHVTRAGMRIGMSQSGMSNALARLRALADDSLFVRTKEGMVPTPLARQIAPQISQALEMIEVALSPNSFDPIQSARTYVLAMPDAIEGLLLGPLLERVSATAPHVRLATVPLRTPRPAPERLRSGVDLAVGAIVEGSLHVETLYHEHFCLLLDPRVDDRRITLPRYCKRPHVVWSPAGDLRGHVDDLLAAEGRSRTVVASACNFGVLPSLLRGSDRIATLPARIGTMLAQTHDLATARVPLEIPRFEIRMAWHPVWDTDAGSRWLREQVRAVLGGPRGNNPKQGFSSSS